MLVNELGQFVSGVAYCGLPRAVADAVKLRVLDVIGASLAGYQLGAHKLLLPLLRP